MLDESPDALDVTVVTRKGTKIRLSEVTPIKKVNLRRRKSVNELVQLEFNLAFQDKASKSLVVE